ncbi:MAG TPA: MotA/TolQ/ExbB proton channel family protein [Polyangiaceae bacterium]|nr:MotA/TolQ/ExbB proton channel family protein [Polyangiaceae bacterium]
MIERLTELMVHSGAAWVLWLLFAISVVSVAIALERFLAFRRTDSEVSRLIVELRKCLRSGDTDGAAQLLQGSPAVQARVVAAGLAEADLGPASAEEAMAAAMGLERKRLERRLLFLGTVGNNAPFIGLLGTVIGVVGAFDELGKPQAMTSAMAAANSLAPERVMGTIAEALVATAVGLIVAIPAVAVYNYFQGRVGAALADAETLGHVLLAHLRAEPEPAARRRARNRHDAPPRAQRDSERSLLASPGAAE